MSVQVYKDPKQFWSEVAPELRREEAKNGLCLGLSFHYLTDPSKCFYQSASRGKSGLLAALICSGYETNINFIPTPVESEQQAKELFIEFKKRNLKITGLIGESSTVDIYKEFFDVDFKVNMKQGIYRCSKVKMPVVAPDMRFRLADLNDAAILSGWLEDFHNEATPYDPVMDWLEHVQQKIKKEMLFVVEKSGQLVSMAGKNRDIGTSCSVNMVFTPKRLRGNGYGSIVTAQLTQRLLDAGKKEANLYTDMSNPTSNKIYQNIGYEFVCHSIYYGVIS